MKVIRSLNTQTRRGVVVPKIVRARFAPSRKANLSNSANFLSACFNADATNPSALWNGGFVMMFGALRSVRRKSCPISPKPRSYRSELMTVLPVSSSTRDMAPSPQAHSQMRSEEHTSELQSLMRISYAVFCLKKKKTKPEHKYPPTININRPIYLET